MTSVFVEIWWVICGGIFTLQITDLADSPGIKITDEVGKYVCDAVILPSR